MKIAIVCFNLKWQAGGTRLIYSLAHGLAGRGHRVVIYAPDVNPDAFPELRAGLDIRIVEPRTPFSWNQRTPTLLRRILRKFSQERLHTDTGRRIAAAMDDDFDAVNLHDFAYKVAPFYKRRNSRARIIWTENDPPYLYLPKKTFLYDRLSRLFNVLKDIRERRYYRFIDRVTVLDFYNKRWAEERGLRPVVVRSGVDFENFYHPVRARTADKKSFALLSLGALNPYRRYEDIIRAVKVLRDDGRAVHATIVAKDIWGETQYRRFLEELVRKTGMGAYVRILFDGATNEELRTIFERSDVFVLSTYLPPPRNGYGWGLANFEAMAAGLPLVICRTSTASEVLEDGKNVLLIDPQDPKSIAEQVSFLIDHPDRYMSIAALGQQFVKEHISWSNYARDLLEVLGAE